MPVRNRAISSMGRCVADSPTRWGRASAMWSSRANVSARCEPRRSRARAWISSTITVVTPRSVSRLRWAVTIRYSDSGVVMRMCGGRRTICCRSLAVVSPVRRPVRIAGGSRPSLIARWRMPSSGSSRLRWMSLLSAFNGDT